MTYKHTPGPWIAREWCGHYQVAQDDSGDAVAGVYCAKSDLANARLIAAAPDLLAALQDVADDTDGMVLMPPGLANKVRAAIAKATRG